MNFLAAAGVPVLYPKSLRVPRELLPSPKHHPVIQSQATSTIKDI